jgi:hypothetical protein
MVKKDDKWLANLTKNDDMFQEQPADNEPEPAEAPADTTATN